LGGQQQITAVKQIENIRDSFLQKQICGIALTFNQRGEMQPALLQRDVELEVKVGDRIANGTIKAMSPPKSRRRSGDNIPFRNVTPLPTSWRQHGRRRVMQA
jgi:hypothetical protein